MKTPKNKDTEVKNTTCLLICKFFMFGNERELVLCCNKVYCSSVYINDGCMNLFPNCAT